MYKNLYHYLLVLLFPLILFGFASMVSSQNIVITQFNNNLYWNVSSTYSADVKMLQQFLTNQGLYTGPITGSYLTQTYNAVVAFQKANGINSATGYFGPETRAKANAMISSASTKTTSQNSPSLISSPTPTVTQSATTQQTVTYSTQTTASNNNLILNPSVETANGAKPLNWLSGKWGTNTTTFIYPTVGQDGAKAVKMQMTSYTSGDAKWFFDDVTVVPGATYTFSEYYKSNVVTNVTVRWTSSTGVLTYQSLGDPAIATNWTLRTNTITVPAGVTKMTIFHLLNKAGTLEVDNYKLISGTSIQSPVLTSVPATVSAWSSWVAVSTWTSCINGTQTRTEERTRSIINGPVNGGSIPALKENRTVSQTCSTTTSSGDSTGNTNEIKFKAFLTSYTYWDNTPPGSAIISHPIIHSKAGGTGTYDDPVTIAVGHSITNSKSTLDYPAGTKFYVPNVRKYFIVEDTCGDGSTPQNGPCHNISTAPKGSEAWLDMWIDGATVSKSNANTCASALTGVYLVIQNPASNYVVVPGSIISNGVCSLKYGDSLVTI